MGKRNSKRKGKEGIKVKLKRLKMRSVGTIMAAALAVTAVVSALPAMSAKATAGLNVISRTQEEISARIKSDGIDLSKAFEYAQEPVTSIHMRRVVCPKIHWTAP